MNLHRTACIASHQVGDTLRKTILAVIAPYHGRYETSCDAYCASILSLLLLLKAGQGLCSVNSSYTLAERILCRV